MNEILVVGEGPTDPPLVCGLTDRILYDQVEWLADQDLDHHRRYRGLEPGTDALFWKCVPELHKSRFRRTRRRFNKGRGLPPDHLAARKLFQLVQDAVHKGETINAVIVFRDADTHPERRHGICNARDELVANESAVAWARHIAIGIAQPKNEAWILVGFEPRDEIERKRLAALRQELGFAPNLKPELLTASDRDQSSKRSAKNILDRLCPDRQRREACWAETSLTTLVEQGELCGLNNFFGELRARIAPLLGWVSRDE